MASIGVNEFIGGTIAGMAQVLSGQPFDIIKVRQATSGSSASAGSLALSIIRKEGLLSFWKGSSAPLLGVGACVSIQFGVLENSKKALLSYKNKPLDTKDYCICGSIAGISNSIVSAPAELFRIKMQVQGGANSGSDPIFKNDLDCIKSIIKTHGIKGAYKGFPITVAREAACFGTYFGVYEYIVNNILIEKGGTKKDVATWKFFLAGGFSGFFFWAPWYPIDAIKSKIQADSLSNPKYFGSLDCVKKTLAAEGVAGLYKGFWTCMLRAFPVNAFTFLVYEVSMKLIS
jgi:solute carrier family 25 (mitochondrial carnitine/acylcarnitine transporter), member 20/29